ncbi:type II toxin-antitoxin system Phd/YefM family antitoxin [Methylohalobius crimeensis]|uniref:type II toxin-antitoxin system Phd/YefM family antitoxin n=1 Tax=Methylohalobius crimeensis TaxID=244365 RepID=UPI0003B365F1|nr:type II toxin-antitoxin system prevent-host-death family antitoxin [Methylohalobius crimeensis]
METTTKYLRFHTKEILAAADRGEEIIVTWHGKPYAKIIGLKETLPRPRRRNAAFGIWRDRSEDVQAQVDRLRAPREV